MILIRFSDVELKRRALGALAGRFSFKSQSTGEMIVPEMALQFLDAEGIAFTVEGPATYEQNSRDSSMLRLKQNNLGAHLRLNDQDLLLARARNPWRPGLAFTRIHIQQDGFAERSIHELQPHLASFWHCDLRLTPETLDKIRELLNATAIGLAEFEVTDDPNGTYRCIDFVGARGTVALRMEDVNAAPRLNVPNFEAAWGAITGLFPAHTSA